MKTAVVRNDDGRALDGESTQHFDALTGALEAMVRAGCANGKVLSTIEDDGPDMAFMAQWGLSSEQLELIKELEEGRTPASSSRDRRSHLPAGDPKHFAQKEPTLAAGISDPDDPQTRAEMWLSSGGVGDVQRSGADCHEMIRCQIGLLLQNQRMRRHIERQERESSLLAEVSRAIAATLDLDQLLRLIVDSAVDAVPAAEAGVIHLLDPEDGYLHPRAMSFLPHVPPDAVGGSGMKRGQGVAGRALATGQVVNVADTRCAPGFVPSNTGRPFRALLSAPLIIDGQATGTLSVDSNRPNAFSHDDEKLISLLALQAATAIKNAQLFAALKRTRDQLVQSEKLSAVGELIAGVAHELNNPLASVMGYAQLLQGECGPGSQTEHDLDRIYLQAQRAAGVVEKLLTFARQREPERALVDANEVLQTTLDFRSYELAVNRVRLETDLTDEELPVLADSNQLQQVFLNVINNAQDAVVEYRGHGTLTVTTKQVGDVARIEFTDDGPGVAPSVMNRIFDPFFTTKAVGRGTGLGLSICYGIVREHGGRVWAESPPGSGATFIVELPLSGEQPREPAKEDEMVEPALPRSPRGRGRILVVDDDEDVLDLIRRVLSHDGYETDACGDAQAALRRIVHEHQVDRDYDLIVTDVKMPGLDGEEFYRRLERTQPHLARRTLFVTGDTAREETITFLEGCGRLYVTKPFAMDQLRQAARKAMAQSLAP